MRVAVPGAGYVEPDLETCSCGAGDVYVQSCCGMFREIDVSGIDGKRRLEPVCCGNPVVDALSIRAASADAGGATYTTEGSR